MSHVSFVNFTSLCLIHILFTSSCSASSIPLVRLARLELNPKGDTLNLYTFLLYIKAMKSLWFSFRGICQKLETRSTVVITFILLQHPRISCMGGDPSKSSTDTLLILLMSRHSHTLSSSLDHGDNGVYTEAPCSLYNSILFHFCISGSTCC